MTAYAKRYLDAQTHDDLHNLIKELIIENTQLKKDNLYYRNIELQLIGDDNDRFKLIYLQSDDPMAFDDYKIKNSELYFMTITFDPERFDNLIFTTSEQQKKYILYSLYKFTDHINFMYGCFEKHQNGIIHSHILINFNDYKEFNEKYFKQLKSRFTRNLRNKYTIDIEPVKALDKVLQYIDFGDKVKYGFFIYYNSTNYL